MDKIDTYTRWNQNPSKGEVFTPKELVNEMLDKIPFEVWENPKSTFCDLSMGKGTFLVEIVKRLTYIYKYSEEDAKSRVFGYEVRVKYINYLKRRGYKNLYHEDSLEKEFKMKFDVVIGNPPYQKIQEAKGKRGGGETLWDKFVIKSLNDVVKENGYLCFIHPTLWRKPQSERSSSRKVNEIMMNKQIIYLEMHNSQDGMKTFNAGTRYDWYVMENCDIYKPTTINGEDRVDIEVDLCNYDFIPNYGLEFFNQLLPQNDEGAVDIIFNVSNYETRKEYVVDEMDGTHIYPLVHSTPKSGTRYKYSSRNDKGHFGIPKVIFGDSGIYDVIIDMDGEYGMTQHSMAIPVDTLEEAQNIRKVLLSETFKEFLNICMWSNFQIDWRLFKHLKKDFWRNFLDEDNNVIESNYNVERV